MSTQSSTTRSAEIRARLGYPIIDADGHALEPTPIMLDYIERVGGRDMVERHWKRSLNAWFDMSPEERRDTWTSAPGWWVAPTRNTLDRATVTLPKLHYQRLDDMGIDFAIVYPTWGFAVPGLEDDEARQASCRAFNTYLADAYREYADRLTPAAMIPMHTPEEAIAELEHAVNVLGLKVAMPAGFVRRPIPMHHREHPELDRILHRFDAYGLDSDYDYDPVWAKCMELGVAVTCHSSTHGLGSRRSISSYMHNQLGKFANGSEILCKSVFFGGVTRRFPDLNFAFLEGGIGWAATLFSGLVGRWEKRNVGTIGNLDPANLDSELLMGLIEEHGDRMVAGREADVWESVVAATPAPKQLDDFAACGIERAEDIRDLFADNFYFGCEADDPTNAWAFDTRINPFGVKLKAMFGSDVGHWDVPDMLDVVAEAYELVEKGIVGEEDFRNFMFTNPAMLHARMNRDFFKGTRVESEVEGLLSRGGRETPKPPGEGSR